MTSVLSRLSWLVTILLLSGSASAEHYARPIRMSLPQGIYGLPYSLVADWQQYLQDKLHRPVELVNSGKFTGSLLQLHTGTVDFAWVTDYPAVMSPFQTRLLAIPLYQGRPLISSYLIVPASDPETSSLMHLEGKILTFADPGSNSHIEQRYVLLQASKNSRDFFRKVFFTHSERESIVAVELGLANAAEVDNFIWDALAKGHPELTAQARIVAKSHDFGAPPVVASPFVSADECNAMRRVLVGMAKDPDGQELLKRLNLDGFIPGSAKLYESLIQMKKALGEE